MKHFLRRNKQVSGGEPSKKDLSHVSTKPLTSTTDLSSLKASKKDGYTFSVPKNAWCNNNRDQNDDIPIRIHGIESRKNLEFVPVNSNRLLLVCRNKTIAILICEEKTKTVRICSFTPPNGTARQISEDFGLFEWGSVRYNRGGTCRMTTTSGTDDDANYVVRCNNKNDVTTMVLVNTTNRKEPYGTFKEMPPPGEESSPSSSSCWECHSKSGIDPAMTMCFIAAFDKLANLITTAKQSNVSSNSKRENLFNFSNSSNINLISSKCNSMLINASKTSSSVLKNDSGHSKRMYKQNSSKRTLHVVNNANNDSKISNSQQPTVHFANNVAPQKKTTFMNARAA